MSLTNLHASWGLDLATVYRRGQTISKLTRDTRILPMWRAIKRHKTPYDD